MGKYSITRGIDIVPGLTERERRERDRIRKRREWDIKHMVTVSTRISRAEMIEFRRYCAEIGETVYSVTKKVIKGLIAARRSKT